MTHLFVSLHAVQLRGHLDDVDFDKTLGNALQHLSQLTTLHVEVKFVEPTALDHLSTLHQLQSLCLTEKPLYPEHHRQPAALPTLPVGLTSFTGRGGFLSTSESCAVVRQLTKLRDLSVSGRHGLDLSMVANMTELTSLQVLEPINCSD